MFINVMSDLGMVQPVLCVFGSSGGTDVEESKGHQGPQCVNGC